VDEDGAAVQAVSDRSGWARLSRTDEIQGLGASHPCESDYSRRNLVTTNAQATISIPQLRRELAGEVIAPDDPQYDDARRVFIPLYDDHRPAVIVRPADAREVGYVVSLAARPGSSSPSAAAATAARAMA
jgi:hypothetical protein